MQENLALLIHSEISEVLDPFNFFSQDRAQKFLIRFRLKNFKHDQLGRLKSS